MKRYRRIIANFSIAESVAACKRVKQSLSVLNDRYQDQADAADRLDRSLTGFLIVLGGVVTLGLAGVCCLLSLLLY